MAEEKKELEPTVEYMPEFVSTYDENKNLRAIPAIFYQGQTPLETLKTELARNDEPNRVKIITKHDDRIGRLIRRLLMIHITTDKITTIDADIDWLS